MKRSREQSANTPSKKHKVDPLEEVKALVEQSKQDLKVERKALLDDFAALVGEQTEGLQTLCKDIKQLRQEAKTLKTAFTQSRQSIKASLPEQASASKDDPDASSSGDYDESRPRPEETQFEETSSEEEPSEDSTEREERVTEDPNGVEPKVERRERKLEVEHCLKDGSTRLFVRNMNHAATDSDLRTFLNKCGKVKDTFWCMNKETGLAYGTAFVEMSNVAGAAAALSVHPLKYGVIGPKTKIRLAKNITKAGKSAQVPSHHVNKPRFTLFVSGINAEVTSDHLRKHFKACGKISDIKVHNHGKSAFVTFVEEVSRDKALDSSFSTTLEDSGCKMTVALPRGPSPQPSPAGKK